MTEDEAKTKWCPFSRIVTVTNDENHNVMNSTSFNTIVVENTGETGKPAGTTCIASECMWFVPERLSKEGSMTVVDGGYCGAIGGSFK